jgi:hypothetical protein
MRWLIASVLVGTALLTALALLAVGSGRPTVLWQSGKCIGGCMSHGPPVPLDGDDGQASKAQAVAARQQSLEQYPFNQARSPPPCVKKAHVPKRQSQKTCWCGRDDIPQVMTHTKWLWSNRYHAAVAFGLQHSREASLFRHGNGRSSRVHEIRFTGGADRRAFYWQALQGVRPGPGMEAVSHAIFIVTCLRERRQHTALKRIHM